MALCFLPRLCSPLGRLARMADRETRVLALQRDERILVHGSEVFESRS